MDVLRYERQTVGRIEHIEPNHDWIRIGLNLFDLYENDGWEEEWAYGFHGSGEFGNQSIATERQVIKTQYTSFDL